MPTVLREDRSLSPPPGWTSDPYELDDNQSFWAQEEPGAPGYYVKTREFEDPHLIMRTTPDNGAPEYLFRSGSRYFFWSEVEDTVWEVLEPKGLEEIVERMRMGGGGRKGLRVKRRV